MRRSSVIPVLAASALLGLGAPAVAAQDAPAAGHPGAPKPVSKVRAYADGGDVGLTWTDPTGPRFDRVVVRYRRGEQAPRHEHGRFGGHRVHVGRHASSATLTHLRHDTTYSVSIWAVGARNDRSAARHTRFTTDDARSGPSRYVARYTDRAGHPLAGVVVSAESLFSDSVSRTAVSGRDGRISLSLPAGEYLFSADGANATGGDSDATGYVPSTRFTTTRAAHRSVVRTVVLGAGGAVRVHVVDKRGRPMAGVSPLIAPVAPYVGADTGPIELSGEPSSGAGRTDADGDATLKGVFPYEAVQVCVTPSPDDDLEFQGTCTSSTVLPRAGTTSTAAALEVARQRGGAVTGVVRNAAHRGFPQSFVEVTRGRHVVGSAETTAGGRFRVPGLRAGTYQVCATGGSFSELGLTGYQPGCDPHPLRLTSVTSTAKATVVLKVGAAATGTVTGPHGAPVADASVLLLGHRQQASAVTSSDGHFVAKGMKSGHTSVCVDYVDGGDSKALPYGVRTNCPDDPFKHDASAREYAVRQGRIRTGLDIRLRTGAAAEGSVVDGRGRPVPDALVEFDLAKGYGALDGTTFDDRRGHFTISGLRSGTYRVCATPIFGESNVHGGDDDFTFTSGGDDCAHHPKVTVVDGHLKRHVRVVVPTTSAVRVTTVDGHGHPVAGVDAAAVSACRRYCDPAGPLFPKPFVVRAGATTDTHGTVLLDGLKPGHYAVCLFAFYGTTRAGAPSTGYADRCSGTAFAVDVRAGHTYTRQLVLHPGGSVSGRITDADGNPLSGVLVHVAGSAAEDVPASDDSFLYDSDEGGASAQPGHYSTTAADGTYTIRSVRPGDRLVCVDPSGATGGSSQGGYLPECVGGAVGSTANGQPVKVTAAHVTGGTELALASAGSVTGHVTTQGRADSYVLLFGSGKVVDETDVGRHGAYGFTGVVPGTYEVCVDSFGKRERGRCYQDAAWNPESQGPPSGATPVQVTAGLSTSGIDVTVPS